VYKLTTFAPMAALVASCLLAAGSTFAADWPQFRGADSNSVTADLGPPVDLADTARYTAWKAALPGRGPASPIVVDGRVVVTASSGPNQDRLHVVCFDAASGEQLWERQFWATGRTLTHPTSANAAPTPASDGKLIFAFYSSNDLACLDLEGNLKWFRGLAYDFPHAGNDVGMASSPVVLGDVVVAQVECQGDSFATGIDKQTGETRWRIQRPREASWASPAALRGKTPADDVVLLQSTVALTAHRAATGEKLWSYDAACDAISSAAAVEGVVYVAAKGMTALAPSGAAEPKVLWNAANLQPGAASVVVGGDRLYIINRSGVLACADTADGQIKWRLRLEGEFWGTPVVAAGRLYCINVSGKIHVVEPAADGASARVAGTGQLDGTIHCSPAVCDGALYVRSDGHLWKIAAP
jgi:outer membrane protein assembly factor BamB